MQKNEVVITTRVDRISRSLKDAFNLQTELKKTGDSIICLSDDVSTKTPESK